MKAFAAETPDQMATYEVMTGMSGLEFVQAIFEGRIAGAPIARTLNMWIHSVEDGEVEFRGIPEFGAMNPMNMVHGGWYGTLLDSALGCAVMTRVPRGHFYTTLEYKVNLCRQIPVGTEVRCIGRVRHSGRSTGVADGLVTGIDDDRVYATGSTTCIIMKAG